MLPDHFGTEDFLCLNNHKIGEGREGGGRVGGGGGRGGGERKETEKGKPEIRTKQVINCSSKLSALSAYLSLTVRFLFV